ncbi:hypothetical protein Pint_18775 [Pistacia integerrima]|uniref:Uncharacterized protein n=1 Tax=Pistacia integerrima TaxID=434235 RepID=A0ACC0YU91_9ROSI|nr:hypothetical protein Pint_18775 [Pistacia integerrima]
MALNSAKLFRLHPFAGLVGLRDKRRIMGAAVKGISDELRRILNANMDQAPDRLRAREAFKDIQLNIDHILFKTPVDGLEMKESYEVNSRGLKIFSKSWLPETSQPKAVVCFCHGYGDTCTFFFEGM